MRTLAPQVRSVSYHPGVMATDLWRSSHAGAVERGYSAPSGMDVVRCLIAGLVKHPRVSGAGLASLADPRSCTAPLLSPPPSASYCCRVLGPALLGGGGGYYQQACCAAVVPVRPTLPVAACLDDEPAALWAATVPALERDLPHTAASAAAALGTPPGDGGDGGSASGVLVHPAWPCTEALAAAPMCVCCACLL